MILPLFVINHIMINQINLLTRWGDGGKDSFEEFNEFNNLNTEYKNKFGFPFILAIKKKNKIEILDNFRKRILSDKKIEFNNAIEQVKKIAILRLEEVENKIT